MQMGSIIHPLRYAIVKREGTVWYFKGGTVFYNPRNVPVPLEIEDKLHQFGLSFSSVAVELFRINGGKSGYYLANLRDKQYYYCGSDWEDVKTTLISLGIGRKDPFDED